MVLAAGVGAVAMLLGVTAEAAEAEAEAEAEAVEATAALEAADMVAVLVVLVAGPVMPPGCCWGW